MQKRANIFYARILFRFFSRKVVFWVGVFFFLGGLLFYKRAPTFSSMWGGAAFQVVQPLGHLFDNSLNSLFFFKQWCMNVGQALEKVGALETENLRLQEQLQDFKKIESENKRLRHLLQVVPDSIQGGVTARVLSRPSSLYSRSLLIGAGSQNGVEKGMAVLSTFGVVGRVIEVWGRISRVLVITDLNSRVPVIVESSQDHAVLSGDNTNYPLLAYAQNVNWLAPGVRILTSGYGGVFPPRLVVGTISQIKNGVIRVQPAVDWGRLEFVRLVKFLPEAEDLGK